jgi:hypothetical protein
MAERYRDLHFTEFHDQLVAWAAIALSKDIINVEEVAATRYSYVLKLNTPDGNFYLKKTSESFFIEPKVIQMLRGQCGLNGVPGIVAVHQGLLCFITKPCGEQSLRTLFGENLDDDLMIKAAQQYINIQQAASRHAQSFLDAGVPDWRLNKLPSLYDAMINNTENLQRWQISEAHVARLKKLQPLFANLCETLAKYHIAETINHSDFQEDNVLLDQTSGCLTIIDWGEVSIGHPFLSLASCLGRVSGRYKISKNSERYRKLQAGFFAGWNLPPGELETIIKAANILSQIYFALTFQELMTSADHYFSGWGDKIRFSLTAFLEEVE